jgi:multisubunit Na+/H+ antiporter MnhF subunit
MNPYLIAAAAVLALVAPLLILTVRCSVAVALVALELASTLVTLVLLLLAAGTNREPLMDLALVSAFLSFAGSLAFARFLERWI